MASRSKSESSQTGGPTTAAALALETWRADPQGPQGAGLVGGTVPVLSVLYHADVQRVGEELVLSELRAGVDVLLSRTGPPFVSRLREAGKPLADRNLSRSPIRLSTLPGGGVRIAIGECSTRVAVRGEPLRDTVDVAAGDLRRGVVIEIAGRALLLLHEVSVASATGVFATGVDDPVAAELLGDSAGMRRLRADIRRVADLDAPVLVRGETGSGKELVARAIHRASARHDRPFVAVNLGAVSASLAVAELFGHEKGAFTGADRRKMGFFQQADGGTLFLDEVGEAPAEIQVALLRALETGEILAVGAQQKQKVDVRVIAATDADLDAKIGEGDFRAPLLHRLASYEIWVPPLRERREDIGRLLVDFLRQALVQTREEHRIEAPPPTGELWFPASLVARLADHDWPGNVRQLANVVRQIVIGSRGLRRAAPSPAVERQLASTISRPLPVETPPEAAAPDAVRVEPESAPRPVEAGLATGLSTGAPPSNPRRKPADIGGPELGDALRKSRWDLAKAASLLGIARASVYALVEASPDLRTAGDLTPAEIALAHRECGGDVQRMVERLEVSERGLRRRLRDLGLDERDGDGDDAAKPGSR
jgi:two-component system, NtrC family, nitrogen regulation response regulator GlnG